MLKGEYNFKITKYLPKSLNYITADNLVNEQNPKNRRDIKSIKFDDSIQEIDSYEFLSSYKECSFQYIKPNGIIVKTTSELEQTKNIIITYTDNKIEYGKFDYKYDNNDIIYNKPILAVYRIKSWNKQYFIVYKDFEAHHINHGSWMNYVEFNKGFLEKIEPDNWSLENLIKLFIW